MADALSTARSSSISFLADLCGSAITRWVFMGVRPSLPLLSSCARTSSTDAAPPAQLFIVSVVLQLLVWRYTANKLGGGDGTKLMSLGAAHRAASSSSSGGAGGRRSLAARWRAWRRKDGAAQAADSDEEHELGGGRAGRGAWSEGSASASEDEREQRKGAGSRRSSYAPVGRVEAVDSESDEERLPAHRSRK